jgi:large subunit ribosomal protein L24
MQLLLSIKTTNRLGKEYSDQLQENLERLVSKKSLLLLKTLFNLSSFHFMKKLRQGDPVKVIAGKFKGKTSKIISVDGDLVVVDGINVMKKAVKGKGFVDKIKPIHISNVMYFDEKAGISKV